MRVDINPEPVLNQVKEDVARRTNQTIYWDSSINDQVEVISVEELLSKELTEVFVVQIALLNNQNLQALYKNLGIAKANLAQAALLKNPIFAFSYQFATQSSLTDLINTSLFQNILETLLIPLKKKTALAELEAIKSTLVANLLEVIAETKIAYYSLQTAQEIGLLKKQILLATELSYEAAQKLFTAGNLKELEVSRERSFYEQAKLDVASWEITILERREKLNVLMGLWGNQIDWKIASSLPEISTSKDNYDNIENEAIVNSVDLKIAYNELLTIAASFGIDTAKFTFPQFDIGIAAQKEDNGVWYAGPGFNIAIPLFDFGQANCAKAEATIMREWNQFTALAIEIRSKARISRFSYLNTLRQGQYLKKVIVPLAEQITHFVLLQHNAMQLGIFHLLAAKSSELEKKIQYIQMQGEYCTAKITLQTLLSGHVLGNSVSRNSKEGPKNGRAQ